MKATWLFIAMNLGMGIFFHCMLVGAEIKKKAGESLTAYKTKANRRAEITNRNEQN